MVVCIQAKTLTGKSIVFNVDENVCVETAKHLIDDIEGIPYDQIRLIWAGKELENRKTLSECGISDQCVQMVDHRFPIAQWAKIPNNTILGSLKCENLIIGKDEDDETLSMYAMDRQYGALEKVCVNTIVHIILTLRGGMFHETSGKSDHCVVEKKEKVKNKYSFSLRFVDKNGIFKYRQQVNESWTVRDFIDSIEF